jgi:hypothetical protein
MQQEFTFSIRIDTTPPTLELLGIDEHGIARDAVTTRNLSKPATIRVYRNDEFIGTKSVGEQIRNVGVYRLVVVDEAGNYTVYHFEIIHAFNAAALAVIGGLLALAVVACAIAYKARKGKYFDASEKLEGDIEVEVTLEEN